MVTKKRLCVFVLIIFGTLSCSNVFSASAGDYQDNGVFLGHAYVKYQSFVDLVNDPLAPYMKNDYKCKYWFVNVGLLNSSGVITNASTELAKVKEFLNAIKTYENANGYTFNVIAWINGDKTTVDVSSSTIRTAIVNECKKFVSTSTPGSYVSDANRVFDGISMDLEPCGNDDTYFNNYKTLMDNIKSAFNSGGLGSKSTSVCAPKYGTGSIWYWSPVYYHYMARRVNFLVAMTYNSESASATEYQTWIGDQIYDILRAVSGKYWNNDATHPAPTNGVKVLIGFPGYPNNPPVHDVNYEQTRYAALGTLEGLTDLQNDPCDPSENYFKSGFVYLHTNGSGTDGYASYTTDWWWWGRYWLGAW
jgi:hypothetical protein